MSLHIYPTNELLFPSPYEYTSKTLLHFANTSDQYIAFKIKSTHSDRFQATPPSGIVPSNSEAIIGLYMLPVPKEMALDDYLAGIKKFKIEWRTLPEKPGLNETIKELMAKDTGGPINETKVLCRFDTVLEKSPPYQPIQARTDTDETAIQLNRLRKEIAFLRWFIGMMMLFVLAYLVIDCGREYFRESQFIRQWMDKMKTAPKWREIEQFMANSSSNVFCGIVVFLVLLLGKVWWRLMQF